MATAASACTTPHDGFATAARYVVALRRMIRLDATAAAARRLQRGARRRTPSRRSTPVPRDDRLCRRRQAADAAARASRVDRRRMRALSCCASWSAHRAREASADALMAALRGRRARRRAPARCGCSAAGAATRPTSRGTSTCTRSWSRSSCVRTRCMTPRALEQLAAEADLLASLAHPLLMRCVRRACSTGRGRTSCSSTSRARVSRR